MPRATDSGGGGRPGAATAFFSLDKTRISRSGPLAFVPSFCRHDLINRARAARGPLNERKAARIGRLAAEAGDSCRLLRAAPTRVGQHSWPAQLASTVGQHSWPAQLASTGPVLVCAGHRRDM